jgi:hypothetical protein
MVSLPRFALVMILGATLVDHCCAADGAIDFNRDIRPILSETCFRCHGPDAAARQAELRLDTEAGALAKRDGAPAIVAGRPGMSELLRRINHADPDQRMPPADTKQELTAVQIDLLRRWIEQGASWQEHWAFQPLVQPVPPQLAQDTWSKTPVDQFVLRRLRSKNLAPAPQAAAETLVRRVAFDLTGLPPTLAEIDRFVKDTSPRAYEEMVDRYLQSDAYGEQMARHWLDLARYADTNGYQYDTERTQWVWRDWVIAAYNRNMPFDQFTIQQLAGDLLPAATAQQRLATGFNRNHGITIEGGVIDEEYRVEYVMDRLVTVGSVWMGLTVGCARCHEHKYDPISQKEFYELFAFFNQVPEGGRGFNPQETIASPLAEQQQRKVNQEIARLRVELAKPVDQGPEVERWARKISTGGYAWNVLNTGVMKSSGGSEFTKLEDQSVLVGGANPGKDIYDLQARTDQLGLTTVRLQALTHPSLPGGGPGRHTNSNFVLSEFELTVVSVKDPRQSQVVKFSQARAEYSQQNYEIKKAIDGTVANNNGWAVDGPTRKKPVTAIFVAAVPFGYEGGSELRFRLRHEANFGTHGVGRVRLSVSSAPAESVGYDGPPAEIMRIASLAADDRSSPEQQKLASYYHQRYGRQKRLMDQITALEQSKATVFPATMVMKDLAAPRQTYLLKRGQYNAPGEKVAPSVPAVFPQLPAKAPRNRLGLAQWLVDPSHPLTARVTVNRYWQRLFGLGLVKTSEDFGVQGELPSHQELFDWLAAEFIKHGWDVKQIHRLILNSSTYRQTSHVGAAAYRADPENRLLARGPRMRLAAEEIRDNALAISGLLVQQLGGKSVYPYQPEGIWMELNNRPGYSRKYPLGQGRDLYRRSLYTFWKRTVPSPMLKTFDAPEREFCTLQRSRTNTPLQSLLLLNGPQFVEAARHLAGRIMREGGDSVDTKMAFGFRLASGRNPSQEEVELLKSIYLKERARFQADDVATKKILQVGRSVQPGQREAADHAAWTSVARMLLNLDEAITKG